MNNILKVSKYILRDARSALLVYYAITLVIALLFSGLTMNALKSGRTTSLGGFGLSAAIFLFVLGLNSFKSNFQFMQSYNISRRKFYFSSVMALSTLALIMTIIDVVFNNVLGALLPYRGIYEQLYHNSFFLADILWTFGLFFFVINLGWFITVLYYRGNRFTNTLVSITPSLVIVVLIIIDKLTDIAVFENVINFVGLALGLEGKLNSNIAVFSFLFGGSILLLLTYFLIKRIPLKDK